MSDSEPRATGTPVAQPPVASPAQPGAAPAGAACPVPEYGALDRRDFLTWIAAGSMAVTGLFALATAARTIMPPARSIEGKTKPGPLPVARVSDLKVGVPFFAPYGDDYVFITKLEGAKIIALNAACPHVKCVLSWNAKTSQYDCPCHASFFTIAGKRISGPAPRDMWTADFKVVGNDVVVSGFENA